MIGNTSVPQPADYRANMDRQPFLATHRALAACSREFERLRDEVVYGVSALHVAGLGEKAVVRQSPSRCIIQLGPVALTIAWLRSTLDSAASGELLIIVWHGAVAPPARRHPERVMASMPVPIAATAVWEQVLVAVAENEATWAWLPRDEQRGSGTQGYTSTELAVRAVERLQAAYDECRTVSPEGSTTA